MIYFLHELTEYLSPLRVFRYITVRAFGGAATAFLLCIVMGPWVIERLRRLKIGQYVRKDEAPSLYDLHGGKQGTPTMGGLLILATAVVPFSSARRWSGATLDGLGSWVGLDLNLETTLYDIPGGAWVDGNKIRFVAPAIPGRVEQRK